MIFKMIIIWLSNQFSYDYQIDFHMIIKSIFIWLSLWRREVFSFKKGKMGWTKGWKEIQKWEGEVSNDEWWMMNERLRRRTACVDFNTRNARMRWSFRNTRLRHEKPTHLQSMWRTASVGRSPMMNDEWWMMNERLRRRTACGDFPRVARSCSLLILKIISWAKRVRQSTLNCKRSGLRTINCDIVALAHFHASSASAYDVKMAQPQSPKARFVLRAFMRAAASPLSY